ncbi:hypothetical protein BGZ98_010392 [Dissophora globulifera]|nr:hypothetical protein BGZ98_010392 [Dissophora globulifera]
MSPSSSSRACLLLLPLLLLLLSHAPALVSSQVVSVYQPIAYSASAILADGNLYIYGGVIKFAPSDQPNTGSSQFLRLDLTQDFNTTSPPWVPLPGYLTFTMIQATPSRSGAQLILGGNRDYPGTLSYIYDTALKQWIATPAVPGVSTMTGYKRANIGMALDTVTGLVYIYGGLQYASFSDELTVLDSSASSASQMTWTLSQNVSTIPALYEPFVLYLPTLKKTIVLAGCNVFNTTSGFVSSCAQTNIAYLISNGSSSVALSILRQQLSSAGPTPRYQSCRVVLPNGNIFIQGGKDVNNFFSEAWILDVTTWTWTNLTIQGPVAEMTRAAHTCQMGPNGQIVLVGGFVNVGNTSVFVTPYMAVIDTNSWTWTTGYKGATLDKIWIKPPNNTDNNQSPPPSGGLSAGAKGGIGAGIAVGVLGLSIGFFFWRRWRQSAHHHHHQDLHHLPPTDKSVSAEMLEKSRDGNSGSYYPDSRGNSDYLVKSLEHMPPSRSATSTATPPLQGTHAVYMNGYPEMTATSSNSESPDQSQSSTPVTTTLATFPSYTGERDLSPTAREAPNVGKIEYPFGPQVSSAWATTRLPEETAINPLPTRPSVTFPTPPAASVPGPIALSRPPEQHGSPASSASLSQTSTTSLMEQRNSSGRVPTLYNSAISTIGADGIYPRTPPGPQSVPEHEAWIQRSSPGVKTHTFTPWETTPDGMFQPLSPTRLYNPHSIVVGEPAPPVLQGVSLFSSAAANSGGSVGAGGANVVDRTGDGRIVTGVRGGTAPNIGYGNHVLAGDASPSPLIYRDPQMMKDLDDIARMIESEALQQHKNPHTIVAPSNGPSADV